MIADVGIHQFFFLGGGLVMIDKISAQLRALVLEFVVGVFQFREILEGALLAVGHFDAAGFGFVFVEVLLLAFLGRGAAGCFDVVGGGVHIGAAISENVLHRQDVCAQAAKLFVDFLDARGSGLACGFVVLLQF